MLLACMLCLGGGMFVGIIMGCLIGENSEKEKYIKHLEKLIGNDPTKCLTTIDTKNTF